LTGIRKVTGTRRVRHPRVRRFLAFVLMLLTHNNRLRMELKHAKARCEELADHAWELKEAEARASSLLEAQGDLIVRRDSAGRITYANDAYCALAGAPREALIGATAALSRLQEAPASVLPDGTRIHDEQIVTADGPRWLAWRDVVVWAQDHNSAEVQSVGRDVTERIETERALAEARDAAESASRAKSRFLAMVSHEIRTPLKGILGMADLLRDTALTPEQASYVKATKASGDALLSLIDEILDFSKIEAGKLDLTVEPFSLIAMVEDAVELLAPRAQAKGLAIASDVDERLSERVIGDATRLRQVLLNLAGNAIKFTETGGVGVVVEAGGRPDEIVFEVRDTGIGIDREQQARIFHEFEQADGGAGRKFGGTGLGLAISRRIMERMGGRIEVASAIGRGSTFRAIAPLPKADSGQTALIAPALAGKAILLVTHATPEAVLLERRLTRWGADVTSVDGHHAANKLTERRWDAVLVDLAVDPEAAATMAGSIADAVARRIVLTTPSERHRLPALKQAGFNGYLVKPIRAASLKAQLATAPESAATRLNPAQMPTEGGRSVALSVLVAEDNEINALLTRALLTKLGHRPVVATSGRDALEQWREARSAETPYDVVLMDLHMPGLDGLEAARRIRAEERDMDGRTPIIALTASALNEDREACVAAGMDGVLVKPVDRERLATTLADLPSRKPIAA
jgi:PAS domain S-box-containing protein